MTDALCARLQLSNDDRARIVWLVDQHMRIGAMPNMREAKRKRLVREPGFEELLEVHRADSLGSMGTLDGYNWIRDYASNIPEEAKRPALLVTGNDLIERGYTPGPLFREILTAIEDAQLENTITTREEALSIIDKDWPRPN